LSNLIVTEVFWKATRGLAVPVAPADAFAFAFGRAAAFLLAFGRRLTVPPVLPALPALAFALVLAGFFRRLAMCVPRNIGKAADPRDGNHIDDRRSGIPPTDPLVG
jgi:hypothetical protein